MDKGKGKEKECFSSDRLFSHKRNVENANIDVELRLGVPANDPKKPKLLNVSSSVTNNVVHSAGKNLNEFQFTVIKIMTSYPMKYMMETEEEVRQRKERVFLHRLKAKKKLQQRRKAARFAKENVNSSLPPSPGSQESVSSIAGASGSGTTTVRAVPSDASLKEMQKLIGDALVEARNEKAPAVTTTSGPKMCKGMFRNAMLSMPLVSTRCVGPNGKTTQGLLYEYKKGEEVKIVCVCHGYFLSAAEFIKHAGGGDVENPLRHIIIKPAANC